jgi:hypothetical protein
MLITWIVRGVLGRMERLGEFGGIVQDLIEKSGTKPLLRPRRTNAFVGYIAGTGDMVKHSDIGCLYVYGHSIWETEKRAKVLSHYDA